MIISGKNVLYLTRVLNEKYFCKKFFHFSFRPLFFQSFKSTFLFYFSRSLTLRPFRSSSTMAANGSLQESTTPTSATAGSTRLGPTNRTLDNQLRTRRKVAKMLIAVVIMFFINFFPVHFIPILQVREIKEIVVAELQIEK